MKLFALFASSVFSQTSTAKPAFSWVFSSSLFFIIFQLHDLQCGQRGKLPGKFHDRRVRIKRDFLRSNNAQAPRRDVLCPVWLQSCRRVSQQQKAKCSRPVGVARMQAVQQCENHQFRLSTMLRWGGWLRREQLFQRGQHWWQHQPWQLAQRLRQPGRLKSDQTWNQRREHFFWQRQNCRLRLKLTSSGKVTNYLLT